jgi:type 1 glutamine amidotransferase
MPRRSGSGLVRTIAIAAFGVLALAPFRSTHVEAQAPAQNAAAASPATPAQAAPFIGDWTISATSQMGPSTVFLTVADAGGKVQAKVKSDTTGEVTVTNVTHSGKSLVLKYSTDYQGMSIPTVATLTPAGAGLTASFSMMDGQFEMSGTGVKGIVAAPAQAAAQGRAAGQGRGAAPAAGGGRGRGPQPQVARVTDVMQMMAALPDSAPATPKKPRRVLVLAKAQGFVHSSIPLAAATVAALGQKTGAWDTVITYDPADITAENLEQYDGIFLDGTTGTFLDDPNDAAATAARRKALLEFVRGGKGLAAIHAATDSYHGNEAPAAPGQGRGAVTGGEPLWPEYNKMIGGYFKWHWFFPTQVAVKIDDPDSPINAPFTAVNRQTGVRAARPFSIVDEVYTFNQDSWSRDNAHVLTSIDYSKMPSEVKAQEPAPQRTDHDYALSYIRREGNGRVFVEVLGHDESIYKMTPMLAHVLAGVQYALGDLEADDTPTAQLKSR